MMADSMQDAEKPLERVERIERVLNLCQSFHRNWRYYKAGWEDDAQPLMSEGGPYSQHRRFWIQVNSNFADGCVLDWCKLFADKKGHQHWRNVIDEKEKDSFETELLAAIEMESSGFDDLVNEMLTIRDKFIAHLDSKRTTKLPVLDQAAAAVRFYYQYLIDAHGTELNKLWVGPRTSEQLNKALSQCDEEAKATYRDAREALGLQKQKK